MKYYLLGFIAVSLSVLPFFFFFRKKGALEPAAIQIYPKGIGSLSCDALLEIATDIPDNLRQEVTNWLQNNKKLVSQLLTIPPLNSATMLKDLKATLHAKTKDINLSKRNYVFDIDSQHTPAVIKIAGIPSRMASMISSLGYDPYTTSEEKINSLIDQATRTPIPTQQHISNAATQRLLKTLHSELIAPINTYLYHLPHRPKTCDDRNYLIVQEKLVGYRPFASLNDALKTAFLTSIPLEELYRAIKFAQLWNISEDNIWVNEDMQAIAYPNGEKPNNEGYGKNARWKVAILGHDLDKSKYNIRNWYDGGHRKFEEILKKYTPELVEKWNTLYNDDPEVH